MNACEASFWRVARRSPSGAERVTRAAACVCFRLRTVPARHALCALSARLATRQKEALLILFARLALPQLMLVRMP
jgi:hypothetical protein